MTTETNSVLNSFKEAFAPMTEAFKSFPNLEVPEAAREFVKKQTETAKVRAADFYAGSEKATEVIESAVTGSVSEVAKISLLALFSLTAVFSVSVGLMNLLPVPMLDGGHLLFYAIEAVRGRPLSERSQEIGLRIGIALVAMLVIFSTSQDVLRLVAGSGG